MQPLELDVAQFGRANPEQIRGCLARQLPELTPAPFRHDGRLVLVGSGPSMPDYLDEIKLQRTQDRPIWAIKGAHDFLYANDCTPEAFLTCDPRAKPEIVKYANDETIYLLASRCHPDMFDALKDKKILVWHSWGQEDENKVFEGRVGIGGGTTSGLRAINVGYVLGFRNFICYGFDSCLAKDGATKRFDGGQSGATIDVHTEGGKKFICNYAMAQQAQDFQQIWDVMPDAHINIRGPGLLAAIVEERKERGLAT